MRPPMDFKDSGRMEIKRSTGNVINDVYIGTKEQLLKSVNLWFYLIIVVAAFKSELNIFWGLSLVFSTLSFCFNLLMGNIFIQELLRKKNGNRKRNRK